METTVLVTLNRKNITEKVFTSQNEPLIAKLSFSGVLKYFRRKLTKKFSLT